MQARVTRPAGWDASVAALPSESTLSDPGRTLAPPGSRTMSAAAIILRSVSKWILLAVPSTSSSLARNFVTVMSARVVTVPPEVSLVPTPHVSLATRPKTRSAEEPPFSIAIPPWPLAEEFALLRTIIGSSTRRLVVSSVVVVPLTVKSPEMITSEELPPRVILLLEPTPEPIVALPEEPKVMSLPLTSRSPDNATLPPLAIVIAPAVVEGPDGTAVRNNQGARTTVKS